MSKDDSDTPFNRSNGLLFQTVGSEYGFSTSLSLSVFPLQWKIIPNLMRCRGHRHHVTHLFLDIFVVYRQGYFSHLNLPVFYFPLLSFFVLFCFVREGDKEIRQMINCNSNVSYMCSYRCWPPLLPFYI